MKEDHAVSVSGPELLLGDRLRLKPFLRLLVSILVAMSMVAGLGRAAWAPASATIHQPAPDMDMPAGQQTGHMMHEPARTLPAFPHYHHHDLVGWDCRSMACCAAVLPPLASVSARSEPRSVAYASLVASGRGITAALEPDPPRPLTL